MRPIAVTVGPLAAASANALALSQTPAAGAITLNGALASGGVVTMDAPREVLITTTGNETGKTAVISGTDWANSAISETVALPNVGTVSSVLSYNTVTSIVISAAAAGALTVGTNGVASSPWVRLDEWALPSTTVQAVVSGTVNYTIQTSLDDPNLHPRSQSVAPALMNWFSSPDPNVVGATTSQSSFLNNSPIFARVLLNSGSGAVTAKFAQSGVVNL